MRQIDVEDFFFFKWWKREREIRKKRGKCIDRSKKLRVKKEETNDGIKKRRKECNLKR